MVMTGNELENADVPTRQQKDDDDSWCEIFTDATLHKMTQRHLNSLPLMVQELDFNYMIQDFSSGKARKKLLVQVRFERCLIDASLLMWCVCQMANDSLIQYMIRSSMLDSNVFVFWWLCVTWCYCMSMICTLSHCRLLTICMDGQQA